MRTRRSLLLATSLFLTACGGCNDEPQQPAADMSRDVAVPDATADVGVDAAPDADADLQTDWFETFAEMRTELRSDPAYLRFERDRVVAGGDPATMQSFVRSMRTIPVGWSTWGDPNVLLYGTRGALRYGAGSMRDKADLLVEMLTQAGFEAEVRQLIGPPQNLFDDLLKPAAQTSPTIDPAKLDEWTVRLGLESSPPPLVDPDGSAADAIAGQIVAALPSELGVELPFNDEAPSQIPIVRFRASEDDEWTFADVLFDDVPLGELPFGDVSSSAFPAVEVPPVHIELRLHTTTSAAEGVLLNELEVPATALAGRQLRVGFSPAGEFTENLYRPITSFTTFLPVIGLQGIDATDAEREEFSAVGDAFTLRGDIIQVTDSGGLVVNGAPLAEADADPATVDAVRVEADGSDFPEVTLRVDPTAAGETVGGISASAFEVKDQGEVQTPTILRNVDRPRVLFILDESTSLPAEFLTDQLAPLVVDIAETILADKPEAEFRIFKVGALPFENDWTQDTAFIADEVTRSDYGSSDIWTALGRGALLNATTCIMITDGEPTDALTPGIERQLESSPPCVFLRAGGDPTMTDLDEMAELVDGEVFEIADQADARTQILDFLEDHPPYLLQYLATSRDAGEHTVDITIGSSTAQATYTVPAAPGVSSITGVELVMTSRARRPEVRRMLFGHRGEEPLAFADAQRYLVSGHLMAFEGEPPLVHEVMDEMLENRLALEPLVDAVSDEDEVAVLEALEQGARWMPPEALAVLGPVPPQDHIAVADHLRGVMVSTTLVGERERVDSIDVLNGPGLGVRSTNPDATAALRDSIAASIRSSMIEDAIYDTATVSLLDGEPLVHLTSAANLAATVPGLSDAALAAWQTALAPYASDHLLVIPADGDPIAFYAVNDVSGAAYGVLADGSGGGATREQLEAQLAAINALLDWLSFGGAMMSASAGFGFWIALSKAIAKQITIATIAITELRGPTTDPGLLQDALNLACDLLRSLLADLIGAGWTGTVEAFIAAVTGEAPIECF